MKNRLALLAMYVFLAASGCALRADGRSLVSANEPDASGGVDGGSPMTAGASAEPAASASPVKPTEKKPAEASASDDGDSLENGALNLNVPARTLGGRFYWSDELVYHDWRIQRHTDNGHCRLIDADGKRQAWGTFDECRARLEAIKREQKLPPLSGKVVLVLHGLVRSRTSGSGMAEFIRENSTLSAMTVGYASTQADVAAHARSLARVIENLGEQVEEIHFVAHSLGNIVIRHYLADQTDERNGRRPDRRIRRIVMVGPPNRGARMAEIFGRNSLFERIVGQSGRAMASEWDDLEKQLAIPSGDFGVIAGGKLDGEGYNPLLSGDDDLILSVEETKLAGARDFIVIEGMHAFMMRNADVQKAALRFLEHGHFVSEDKRQPL
jgi:pimeloyl-ACP methyl ester carboxylesterase